MTSSACATSRLLRRLRFSLRVLNRRRVILHEHASRLVKRDAPGVDLAEQRRMMRPQNARELDGIAVDAEFLFDVGDGQDAPPISLISIPHASFISARLIA